MKIDDAEHQKLIPVLDSDGFWMIGDNPDLGVIQGKARQECVDHHVFQSEDGFWHLWGCIRNTAVGRILYHWETKNITDEHWQKTGEMIRVDNNAGESINDWYGQEWIQSPYVIKDNNLYYMFYGGHSTGTDILGRPVESGHNITDELSSRTACQMCLMTSKEGRKWVRYKNEKGQSRLFIGPGEVRDPVLIKIGNLWYLYHAGSHYEGEQFTPSIYVRTSKNLIHWSNWKIAHSDINYRFGHERGDPECPHVVKRGGYYYLFITKDYAKARTYVFRSEDPMDFGIGDATSHYVGLLRVAAPEIIIDMNGQEYITSNHNLTGGTMICKLNWAEE